MLNLTSNKITQQFELYIALSPRLPKSAAIGTANAVTRWVKKEEGRLFLKDAPVFWLSIHLSSDESVGQYNFASIINY